MEIRKIEKRKTHVALVIDSWFPACSSEQIHVSKLAEILATDHNYKIDIITRRMKGKLRREERELEKFEGVRVKRLLPTRLLFAISAFFYLLFAWKKYQIVHAHSALSAVPMKAASWFTHVPTVLTVHSSNVFQNRWTLRKLFDRVMCLETKYSQEISISEKFLKATNVNEQIVIMPNGIDTAAFDEVAAEKDPEHPERFVVIFVGRLVHDKGVDLLLEAVHSVLESTDFIQSKKDFLLHIVGDGPEAKHYEKLAEKLGIAQYVKFHGKVTGEALVKLYKSSDLFVLPSRHDGLPLTLLEACASHLPILASDVGDVKRVVLENVNGHLVQPDDAAELAYYLEHFASNPQLHQMGEASYDIATQEYNWDIAAQKTIRIYENLIQKKEHGESAKTLPSSVSSQSKFMPWQVPGILLRNRKHFAKMSRSRFQDPVKFCLTVNVEQAYAHAELPHETKHLEPFFERFSDFCNALEIPSTLFVQSDLFEEFAEEIGAMEDAGHEIGIKTLNSDWLDVPTRKKALRNLREMLDAAGFKKLRMLRAHKEISETDLQYMHELGFENLPTSEDPMPHIRMKYFLPFGYIFVMNLKNLLATEDDELLEIMSRICNYQKKNKVAPFVIFQCNSWEFQSRDYVDYASGENFTKLSKKIAFLKEHMELEFLTLSDFCKSCMVPQ